MSKRLIRQLQRNMVQQGYVPGTEHYDVCSAGLQFLGLPYQQSEELLPDHTDCSTLTSQSHWLGACLRIPFTAQWQRDALFGVKRVAPNRERRPGDVVVKFKSLARSPGNQHNHVALYLGRDTAGVEWVLESEQGRPVRLNRLSKFNPKGGVRRFIFSTERFCSLQSRLALSLAARVPKLGRLGAGQRVTCCDGRQTHRGVDIYLPVGTLVHAGVDGTAKFIHAAVQQFEHCNGIEITAGHLTVRYLMLSDIWLGHFPKSVKAGDLIGCVSASSPSSSIIYSDIFGSSSHLHMEVEVPNQPGIWNIAGHGYLDPLYLIKTGKLRSPVSADDLVGVV